MRFFVASALLACLSTALAAPIENCDFKKPAPAAQHQDRQSIPKLPISIPGLPTPTKGADDSSFPDVDEILSDIFPAPTPGSSGSSFPDVDEILSDIFPTPTPGSDGSSFPDVDGISSALQGAS